MLPFLPYIALVAGLLAGGIAWGQNEQRIKELETHSPDWVQIKVEQAKIEERVSNIDRRQLRMNDKLDDIFKAVNQMNMTR